MVQSHNQDHAAAHPNTNQLAHAAARQRGRRLISMLTAATFAAAAAALWAIV